VSPPRDSSQQSLTEYFPSSATTTNKCKSAHGKQKAISKSIVEDLIVNCSMPISIVENAHFRHFLSVTDPQSTSIPRHTVSKMLDKLVQSGKDGLTNQLSAV
jgi:hypothetical protein